MKYFRSKKHTREKTKDPQDEMRLQNNTNRKAMHNEQTWLTAANWRKQEEELPAERAR